MPLVEDTLLGRTDKVKTAIERIRTFDPLQNGVSDNPYYVAYSGGKDSDALRVLFELSGVKYDLVHNHTTIDAPETVRYIRSIPGIQVSYPEMSMWKLIITCHFPPTRYMRYCCSILKERSGLGRFVSTGVRWSESNKRKKNRGSLELQGQNRSQGIILNADNDSDRKFFETCITKKKHILNPIIDWLDEDVWEFLNHHQCRSNPLYGEGWNRIGCIGCPMAAKAYRGREFIRWPKYKENYIKTFDKMLADRIVIGKPSTTWRTGQEVFDWWIADTERPKKYDPNQMDLFAGYDINLWEEESG